MNVQGGYWCVTYSRRSEQFIFCVIKVSISIVLIMRYSNTTFRILTSERDILYNNLHALQKLWFDAFKQQSLFCLRKKQYVCSQKWCFHDNSATLPLLWMLCLVNTQHIINKQERNLRIAQHIQHTQHTHNDDSEMNPSDTHNETWLWVRTAYLTAFVQEPLI